jgi:hypothetical protein
MTCLHRMILSVVNRTILSAANGYPNACTRRNPLRHIRDAAVRTPRVEKPTRHDRRQVCLT